MANEIQTTVTLTYTNGNAKESFAPGAINISQSAQGGHFPIVQLTTAPTAISFGSVGTPGIVCGRNLDASKWAIVGPTTNSTGAVKAFIKVMPGEPFLFRLNGSLWKWYSSSGTMKLQMQIYEN